MRSKHMVYVAIGVVIGVLLSAGTMVLAGTLDPASGPTNSASQMYTLQQIYDQLTSGDAGTKMTTFTEPSNGPGTGTMVTLDQVMAEAPAIQTNAATPEEVVSGSVVWGLSEDDWGIIEGTRPYLPLLKTGQTTCFSIVGPFGPCTCGDENCPAGQDGGYQMGVPTISPRFTDNNDGTVTDNMTGLIWLRNANCQGTEYGSDWFTAIANVAELNATGQMVGTDSVRRTCDDTSNTGGTHQTDWRLPNLREMHSLIDYQEDQPSLPRPYPFTNVYNRWYWTSTTHATYHGNAWFVSMWGGRVFHLGKDASYHVEDPLNYRLYIWPVRGGQQ